MECWRAEVRYNGKRVKNTAEHFLVIREMDKVLTILQMGGHGQENGGVMFKMDLVVTNFQVV